jgi:hypothetical protein
MTVNVSYAQPGLMTPVVGARRVRTYFAPVNRATNVPSVFDPAQYPEFALDSPPAPWIDCGPVANFRRVASTKMTALTAGAKGMAQAQARGAYGAQVEFDFLRWGKLQMAISCGSQPMNLLAEIANAPGRASGSTPAPKVAVLAGSTATEVAIGTSVADFSEGDLVVVDRDYALTTGYVGAGVPGAYVKSAADVGLSLDYVRRVSFNVSRVRAKTANTLLLTHPLIAGAPGTDMGVQKVVGFTDREGGSFFQEWSALFVLESETGARAFFHYPRVQTATPARESATEIADGFDAWRLPTTLIALPTTDTNDSEQVLCYRSFVPGRNAAVY